MKGALPLPRNLSVVDSPEMAGPAINDFLVSLRTLRWLLCKCFRWLVRTLSRVWRVWLSSLSATRLQKPNTTVRYLF